MADVQLADLSAALTPGQAHHQNWYAVALSEEVQPHAVLGKDFLNGRVAVYRKRNGEPVVLTSRCPHMGADLSLGDVIDDQLRCTYHHFCFAEDGGCTSVPAGNRVPRSARVFSYPCVEKFGLIWAFNGEEPLFPPPDVRGFSCEELSWRVRRTDVFSVAPFVNVGNSFDYMHLRYVHGLEFAFDPAKVNWVDDFHIETEIEFGGPGSGNESRIRVTGTNTVAHVTVAGMTSIGLFTLTPIGTESHSYFVSAAPTSLGYPAEDVERCIAFQEQFSAGLLIDDVRTLSGLRFQVGSLVQEDKSMIDFLKWVQRFPTATPTTGLE